MPTPKPARPPRSKAIKGPSGSCSLWIAIPLDVAGLYLLLAGLHLIPQAWPVPALSTWILVAASVALFMLARTVALLALRGLLRWRIASDAWSRIVTHRSHFH